MLENAWEWDTRQCGIEMRRCLDLNPNYATGVAKNATSYLQPVGRFEEGMTWLKRALVLDPLSPTVRADCACNLVFRGLFNEFEREAAGVLEDDPAMVRLHWFLAKSRAVRGNHAGAVASAESALGYLPEDPITVGIAAGVHAMAGSEDRAAELRGKIEFLAQTRYVPFTARAFAYEDPDNGDLFFRLLDQAIEERDPVLRSMRMTSCFSSQASDRRFASVLDRSGLGEQDVAQVAAIDLAG
jgi:tetratricopeptide (TPR) repeat protein